MLSALSLVIVIVIDQMRTDELFRAQHLFRKDGISRLLEKGVFYDDAHQSNFYNMTCVGHAAISTGAHSGLTGILMNAEYDFKKGRSVYCVEDEKHQWIEAQADMKAGGELGTSAEKLHVTTIGDELKSIWPKTSHSVAVAQKDRAAILLAGHLADGVYFYAPKTGIWTTSTAYNKSGTLPAWLKTINSRRKSVDEKTFDVSAQSAEETVDIALAAAKAEALGTHATPDLLSLSFSVHDHVGHEFGDDSEKIDDILKIEDSAIARLIAGIRKNLPASRKNKILVVFTGDHGVAANQSSVKAQNLPGGYLTRQDLENNLIRCIPAVKKPILWSMASAIYLDPKISSDQNTLARAKACLSQEAGILQVITKDEILSGLIPRTPWFETLASSYTPQTGPDLIAMPKPYWSIARALPGIHETPYDYDSWVPLAFWSPQIKARKIHSRVSVMSLAPTLARLLKTRKPSGSSAPYLAEVLGRLE